MSIDKTSFEHITPKSDRHIFLSGISYREVPIELRERFSLYGDKRADVLRDFLSVPAIHEAVVVSTCNRVEVVTTSASENTNSLHSSIEQVFSRASGLEGERLATSMYHLDETKAVGHLFRVASGLDSMILGEPQILGQLKDAYQFALESGSTRSILNRLFHRAFGVAKAVRTHTGIGRHAVSMCYAAKVLAEQIFGELADAKILLLGAGETGALALKHFHRAGSTEFFVLNKTLERAAGLAQIVDGIAGELHHASTFLPQADIIIGAASISVDQDYLISAESVSRAMKQRRGKPQLYLDLGVPRNFDPTIAAIADTFIYNVDDLDSVVRENLDKRSLELERAELIIEAEVERFHAWREQRKVEPAIRDVMLRLGQMQDEEIGRTIRRLSLRQGFSGEMASAETRAALEDLSKAIVKKTLHRSLEVLKTQHAKDESLVQVFREFFLENSKSPKK